jgi:hypothetical protein
MRAETTTYLAIVGFLAGLAWGIVIGAVLS